EKGHEQRFLEKLNAVKGTVSLKPVRRRNWWQSLSIAASVALLFSIGLFLFGNESTKEDQVAEISPEVSKTQFYFANLIEEQVRELEKHSSPETEKIISDAMTQLKKLEANYSQLEQDLLNGGNSKLILSAMITNFQTRIDLLRDVQVQIETIKNLKAYKNENISI
ncbi:MAG: hypothetical protein AAFX53_05560, partial [Bacteroidota bacterium]